MIHTFKCKQCGNPFTHHRKRYICSPKCLKAYQTRPDIKAAALEKREAASMLKYGVKNPAQAQVVKDLMAKTCIEKYGCMSPLLNEEVNNKVKATNLERYGFENAASSDEIRARRDETMIARYGVKSAIQNNELKAKTLETVTRKYGVNNPSKNDEVKKKARQTCIERYGHPSSTQNDEIKNKIVATNMAKYNVPWSQLNTTMRLKISTSRKKANYRKLFTTDKLGGLCKPLFTEEEYINRVTGSKLKFECTTCAGEIYSSLVNGRVPRCNICFPPLAGNSKFQDEVANYVKSIYCDGSVLTNNWDVIDNWELDVYIPSQNIAIECNGNYWHSEVGGKKYTFYHVQKTRRCEAKGIKLIHIFEDEWLLKRDIIKRRLAYALGVSGTRIHARKCKLAEVPAPQSNQFLDTYHIQGADKSPIRIGAFYNDELVAVMTFGKLRKALGQNPREHAYEMYRFCVGENSIPGIASRLFSYFVDHYHPHEVTSYADRRWTSDLDKNKSAYAVMGFKFVKHTYPNYWYLGDNYFDRFHRYAFRKSELTSKLEKYDPNLTEWENMKNNGYDRIWDCGHLKYQWFNPNLSVT
jgi:hypothetical protein